jgi:hypothetical protein
MKQKINNPIPEKKVSVYPACEDEKNNSPIKNKMMRPYRKISFLRLIFDKLKGKIIPIKPRIKRVLEILLPMIFPKTISDSWFKLAIILMTSSGRDVPIETRVRPITISEIEKRRANALAPSTTYSPPFHKRKKPRTNKKNEIITKL